MISLVGIFLIGCQPQKEQSQDQKKISHRSETAINLNHDYVGEGIQFLKEANTAKAIQSFDQAIKQDPMNPRPYIILGETYMRMREYNRAVDTFTAASRLKPDDGEVEYLLAVNYGLAGNKKLAQEHAQKSLDLFRLQQDEKNFVRALALVQGLAQE